MSKAFPYQLVGFLDKEPVTSEPVYSGENGWYPQIALKRRFNIEGMGEEELLAAIQLFCSTQEPLQIIVGKETKTERMPVKVIEVEPTKELLSFNQNFIKAFGASLKSRFPEREDGYYPHITSEYNGKQVVNVDMYTDRTFTLNRVWLLKDKENENSQAYASFELGEHEDLAQTS